MANGNSKCFQKPSITSWSNSLRADARLPLVVMCNMIDIMNNKLKSIGIVFLLSLSISAGTLVYASNLPITEEWYDVLIIGSAEHPDPVLEKVRVLEKKGMLRNVIVMESFPVQIRVTGPKMIIEEIQKMPRKISPNFK